MYRLLGETFQKKGYTVLRSKKMTGGSWTQQVR